jgi:hypothetical protein
VDEQINRGWVGEEIKDKKCSAGRSAAEVSERR